MRALGEILIMHDDLPIEKLGEMGSLDDADGQAIQRLLGREA